ncbi:F-actin-monooxygenase MICAL2 isoform X2 [Anser cygnoides]|uniref:F-actin-monooxygenase MICAL2 isoform X2 n=1 Tax=Anser cygnoides TaxID=8845 RepID=UPI002009400E|nr:F-actin-monooxygenase MICAL2 isoform X1 [Anser cygnoides]XP_047926043.1 F-actin-monooxygenase MICAL2 isoform X1 [Anser cygnoides]XP_047926044.1 F-actin-monooxygenase MICAL2 isoform X1 [Anser cygnoides]XP_047926045.1 F-actin-monooxygenase MICAL2 isoform X1 [Anser cygnoides]XP_047926046.1 F-actin-monooxygenase MICAL2 isoform X1 [Anser cygnoides]XP_047926047.1 F-actin-monooxygenase MICAL2 isoform X1 [Anser cygnoides]XP_047926048.1 F-actin-monooxygenase MICAL2 isoform X1 [Anser cygnoides]XP_0
MGENDDEKYSQAGQIFENFVQASTCKGTIQAFNILTRQLELDPLDNRNFYTKLKSRVTTWKAKALWNKLDKRASHKEYKRGKSCMNTKCLIIGGGPCGLRTAIELAFLGAKVVVVEKRDTFSRNNVLHLWPFTIHDLRGLGAKKFYGKFCAGSIDHISIRQLQLILFKVALILGVEIHVNLEFVKVLEPPEDQENQKIGWRAEFLPVDHPLSEYEFDVVIGADGRRNTLEGFRRKEFRGKLAIAITANFINRNTTAEAKVEEISGVAFIFNQKFFQDLKEETGIDLENIVYYKDSTHYFVMTAKKQSLLDKGVIIKDYIDTELLLCGDNVNQSNLLSYAREAADFATNYQLPSLDFAINHYGQPDVAMFDFTSMYASENAALVRERHRHQLLVALVGDSLLEPFWPMGTGCARGFLAAFDTVWMVRSWAQGKPPLEILAERESIYRLLPQTTPENINKNFDQYTIDPGTRYPNLNSSCVRPHQVRQLFVTNELQQCPLERVSSIRRSVNLSRHESDIRPNKLLTWCQKQTEGYRNVSVTDLTTSWKSGLALCAIIHHFRPDLIDFDALNEEDVVKNNQLAFDVAEREFGIPPVTTGKEVGSAGEPDKLSMVMYLSKFYELFRGTPLQAVDAGDKRNGENNDLCSAKSSNFIFNNYINLTLPRKRVPKVEGKTEENETNKRRRKGLFGVFEEASGFSSQTTSAGKEQNDSKEGMNQNKVKSMATQLLAKFEENAPNTIFRRQEQIDRPALVSSDSPVNPRFAKPKDPNLLPPQPKRQFQVVARTEHEVREPKQSLNGSDHMARRPKTVEKTDTRPSLSETSENLASACSTAFVLSGVLKRLQNLEEKMKQKRAQTIANREFHKKNIKEKAAHLASMFGYMEFPKSKLPTKGLSHSQPPTPCCLLPHDSAAACPPSSVGSTSPALPSRQGSLRKEFPQSIGGSDICYFCKKRVYVMERLSAEGHFFHRECFKCEICSTTLRLGIYAFDVEEGKFYCKPHFTHCKISNKHRKRRATLQVQGKEATEARKKEEPKSTETTTESTLTTASSPEDRSPGCCQPVADEPTSLKKAKSILECHNLENWSPSPEWTTVRVIPEEEMTEHNLLAIRVIVTSDASSSELESDFNGDSSNSEVGEGETSLLELPACPSPPRRWASLSRSPVVPEESHKTSKVADALQRANSFHSTALTKYQNWRRKIQTNFPLLSNKKPGLQWKESSSSCQCDLGEDQFQTQKPPEVTRGHVQTYSPVSQKKEVREMSEDVHLYVPHCPFQSRARGSPQIPCGNGKLADEFLEPEDIDCDNGTCTGQSWNENKQNYTSESQGFNRNAKVLPSLRLKEKDEKNTRHPEEKFEQELKEAKKRLVLCTEQQPMLYESNGVDLGGTRLQYQNKGVPGISEEKDTDWRKGVFKQSRHLPLLFADDVPPALPVDMKGALKNPDTAAKAPTAGQPKSPLRLIANAIKRSILEPLTLSTEGLKQDSDSKSKASSELVYFSFPSTPGYSLSQRNSNNDRANNSQPQELKTGKQAGEYLGITCNSLSTPSNFSVSSEEISPSEYTKELFFPVYSPHSRPSRTTGIPQKSPCTRMEDVPGLLEKFTFKETPPVAPRDDVFTCNEKYLLASSRESKNTPRDNLDDSTQKSSLGSLFDRLRSKVREREGNFLVSSLPFVRDRSAEDRLHFPSAGCEHPTVRKETAEYSTSSSDDEFESKPSLTHKAKMSLRRRRKLEKETKQMIKQEELKRLHKAQAVQRQLEELEERQRALEIFGVKLERELRGESDSGTQDETQMLHEWFELVLEKNKLMRYESELLIVAQELELEDHQSRLEQKLREKMAVDDSLKDEMDLNEEDEIFTEMMKVVEERDKLVSALEEQRVKEKAEDQHFESIILSRGYQLSGI